MANVAEKRYKSLKKEDFDQSIQALANLARHAEEDFLTRMADALTIAVDDIVEGRTNAKPLFSAPISAPKAPRLTPKRRSPKEKKKEIADAKDVLIKQEVICPHCGKKVWILL